MKIPFQKERTLSTSELPGVICSPSLVFHFDASPNIEFIRDLAIWGRSDKADQLETIRLGAIVVKAVTLPDGDRHELGTPDSISDVIQQTKVDFMVSLLSGWSAFIQTERLSELGKLKPLSMLLSGNGKDQSQV